MNNNIELTNGSLEDDYKAFDKTIATHFTSFVCGITYQKEKDKAIIDKLSKRLESLCKAIANQIDESGNNSKFSMQVTENYNRSIQLLNKLKETK